MGLAEQINPEQEALCVVVDKGIYVWAYDKPQKIVTHKERISSLSLDRERLVFCDGINGIYDSLNTEHLAYSWPWEKIAQTPEGGLYGILNPMFNDLAGAQEGKYNTQYIFDLRSREDVATRDGETRMLAGQPFLMDAGVYAAENVQGEPIPDTSVYDTLRNTPAVPGRPWGIEQCLGVAPTERPDELYVALNTLIERRKIGEVDPTFAHLFNAMMKDSIPKAKHPELTFLDEKSDVLFRLTSPPYQRFIALAQLSDYFTNYDLREQDREKVWVEFNKKLEELATIVPRSFFKVKYHPRKPALALLPVPYKDAMQHYAPVLEAVKDKDQKGWEEYDMKPPHPLAILFRVALRRLKDHCFDKYGIYSMAKCNNQLAIGLGTGELVIKDLNNLKANPWVVWHFGKPIEAMLSVPIEVYDDGIKQHVLERIKQRAYFAGQRKNMTYQFNGVPQPLRKTG